MNEQKENNIHSYLGLIFGCISIINLGNIILSILGIVFSNLAKKENENDIKSKIGLTLSIISLVISISIIIIFALLLIYRVIFIPFD